MSQEEDGPVWTPTAPSVSETESVRSRSEPEAELEAESEDRTVFPDFDPAAVSMCPEGMSHARTLLDRVMESRDWPDKK